MPRLPIDLVIERLAAVHKLLLDNRYQLPVASVNVSRYGDIDVIFPDGETAAVDLLLQRLGQEPAYVKTDHVIDAVRGPVWGYQTATEPWKRTWRVWTCVPAVPLEAETAANSGPDRAAGVAS